MIIDQIEEIFIRFPGRESREKLGGSFGKLIRGDQPCKVICAIRKDYFLDLYDLATTMDIDVSPTLVLHNFSPDEAKEVIAECATAEGLNFTDELVGKIVSDLTKEGQIRPPELQIVCTALTGNFTLRHYSELGGAKGILESYLKLTLETCIDQHLARLILRQMCDFERQAKAHPKTAIELAHAIAPQQDDSGAAERTVQLVLDHLVRSRLAVIVNGKTSLIHDYWVSVIHDITAHDQSEHEKADELLRRHLYELDAGFSPTLNSKQLNLVRRFANRDLLATEQAIRLLRKSTLHLSVSRGIAVGVLMVLLFLGMRSSHVLWEMKVLYDSGPGHAASRQFLKDIDRLVLLPWTFGPQKRSSISVWDTKNGKRLLELTVDAWAISEENGLLLYSDGGRGYSVDLKRLTKAPFPQQFTDGDGVIFSRLAHCAIYNSLLDIDKNPTKRPFGVTRIQLWSVPEGKLTGSIELQANGIDPVFVSDNCGRAVFRSKEGASLFVSGNVSTTVENGREWIWSRDDTQPKPVTAISRVSASVNEETKSLITLEMDKPGSGEISLWDLEKGLRGLERRIDVGQSDWEHIRFGLDGKYVVVTSSTYSEAMADLPPRVVVVRSSDLQEPQLTKDQRLIECHFPERDFSFAGYLLWSVAGQGGYIWNASSDEAIPAPELRTSDVRQCSVSPDRSELVVLRNMGSAELWSLSGKKVADLLPGEMSKRADWTLQGTAVKLISSNGDIFLFDRKGRLLVRLTTPGSRSSGMTTDVPDVSFEPSCKHAFVWTPDGRLIKYTKKLKILELPYSIPFFWQPANASCEE